MEITREMKRNGKTIATVTSVQKAGVNYRVDFDNGHTVLVPKGALSAEVAAMLDA